ncbi:MAG: desulfoferrodoxin family protein [Coriobacteriales bacterium]|nr:desulfoferrodoxin family protein [Coriobacteriales bacterium]
MAEVIFYRCNKCGNLVYVVNKGTCVPQCCGEPMEKLEAGSTDAATEKHVPEVCREDGKIKVQVGSVEHPMMEKHFIQWIALAAEDRVEIKYLHPDQAPVAEFADNGGDVTVYEYCNLHGLWKAEA